MRVPPGTPTTARPILFSVNGHSEDPMPVPPEVRQSVPCALRERASLGLAAVLRHDGNAFAVESGTVSMTLWCEDVELTCEFRSDAGRQ
jgi:hypothetical protein